MLYQNVDIYCGKERNQQIKTKTERKREKQNIMRDHEYKKKHKGRKENDGEKETQTAFVCTDLSTPLHTDGHTHTWCCVIGEHC